MAGGSRRGLAWAGTWELGSARSALHRPGHPACQADRQPARTQPRRRTRAQVLSVTVGQPWSQTDLATRSDSERLGTTRSDSERLGATRSPPGAVSHRRSCGPSATPRRSRTACWGSFAGNDAWFALQCQRNGALLES